MAKNKKESEETLKAKLQRWWEQDLGARKNIDWQWFINDLWVSGRHYAKWDRNTQTITTTIRDKGRPKVVVNKVFSTLRSVRNFVTRNQPKAVVTPADMTEDNIEEANKLTAYLEYLHDKLRLDIALKAVVWSALKNSVGYWQVLWNEDAEDGKGEIDVNFVDEYDVYWDSVARQPKEAKRVTLSVRRSIADLENDSKYDQKAVAQLKEDNLVASSTLKARFVAIEKGNQGGSSNKEGTVIVRETWYKELKKDSSPKIMVCAMANNILIRKPEDTGLDRFPFFRLQSDVDPLSMYGQGWVKNLIPLNRQLNRLESQVAEYNDLMNRGKWIADKGAGVRVINNENGQIIEKKKGFDVIQGAISPLANAIFNQIENMNRYIEDIGGAHDASMGRIPTGAKSGKALEALQVGDANNMSEVIENTENFLEDVYEYILNLASQKYQFARNIAPLNSVGERDFIKVIGEESENQPEDALVVKKNNLVDVKIGSWLANTPQARKESILELAQVLPDLDPQTILEAYEVGNISDVIKRMKERQEENIAQQQVIKQGPAPAEGGVKEVASAIREIINGQQPVFQGPVGEDGLAFIDQFLQAEEAQGLDREVIQAIQSYRDQLAQGGLPMESR